MLWGELWMVAGLCLSKVRRLGAASLAANLFPAKSAKGHLKRSWEKKKRDRGKHVISRNSETTLFLGKT